MDQQTNTIEGGCSVSHDNAEGRDEDTDGEADANPPEHDDALLALRQEQGEQEDKPEHTHIQEEEDLRREELHRCAYFHVSHMHLLRGSNNV